MIFLDPVDVAPLPSPLVSKEHEGRRFSALVVSADRDLARIMASTLAIEGVEFEQARSSEGAWRALSDRVFSLIVADLDLGTPVMGLLAFLGKTRPETSLVVLADESRRSMAVHALRLGARSYALKPVLPEEFTLLIAQARRQSLLTRRLENYRLEQQDLRADLVAQEDELRTIALEMTSPLRHLLEINEIESPTHMMRIGVYSAELGAELGWPMESLRDLLLAAELHDLGQACLPASLLRKCNASNRDLSQEESRLLETHTELGAALFGTADIPFLNIARNIALHHHERWDGAGYPRCLQREEIPLEARIVAVVDTYESYLQARADRSPAAEEDSLAYLACERGRAFDPAVVDAFMDLFPHIRHLGRQNLEGHNLEGR